MLIEVTDAGLTLRLSLTPRGFAPATRPGQLTRFAGISGARLKAMADEDERRRRYEELLAQPLGQQ